MFKLKVERHNPNVIVEVYTDGGLVDKNPSKLGGTWAWVAVNGNGAVVSFDHGYVPSPEGREITNNHMEQIAIVKALEALPDGWSGKVCSDSDVALGRVFRGNRTRNLPNNIIERTNAAKARMGTMSYELLQGHPTQKDLDCGIGKKRGLRVSEHNEYADELCLDSANEYRQEHGMPLRPKKKKRK